MAEQTNIEWCDSTLNFWQGCTRVSEAKNGGGGCDNCYAERMDRWLHKGAHWGPGAPRLRVQTAARTANSWQRSAAKFRAEHGRNRRVFVNSTSDWLDNEAPIDWLVELLDTIRQCPDVTFLLLSKRIGNWHKRLAEAQQHINVTSHATRDLWFWVKAWRDGEPPANVWIGATAVNQAEADRDIQKLMAVPAAVLFLSIEPMLGPVDLRSHLYECCGCPVEDSGCDYMGQRETVLSCCGNFEQRPLHWVIVGGESGPKARPFDIAWARSLAKQCKDAGVAFHMKQLGAEPRGWCAGRVHADPGDDLDDDFCDFYEAHECGRPCPGRCAAMVHKKGGDMAEWPEDLRVREFPEVRNA